MLPRGNRNRRRRARPCGLRSCRTANHGLALAGARSRVGDALRVGDRILEAERIAGSEILRRSPTADRSSRSTRISPLGDPLGFKDSVAYSQRIADARARTGKSEAVVCGFCTIEGRKVALGVFDFGFLGGSMGSVAGEKLTRLAERALAERAALVLVSASGGARMQEGILSLMQMAKVSAALGRLADAGLPYVSVLTTRPRAASPRRWRCSAISTSRSPERSSASPDRASSSRRSATRCPKDSRRPSSCSRTA